MLAEEVRHVAVSRGAFRVGIARPTFARALEGCRPRDLMPDCESVICFAVFVGSDYYQRLGLVTHHDGKPFARPASWLIDSIALAVSQFLFRRGIRSYVVPDTLETTGSDGLASSPVKLEERRIVPFSMKLAAFEAGLGVYGRNSTIITPEHGSQVYFRAILTDHQFDRYDEPLKGYEPCHGCRLCADLCPAGAIDPSVPPPQGHDRIRCKAFVFSLPEFSSDPVASRCGLCTDRCPRARLDGFTRGRHYTLLDHPEEKARSISSEILESREFQRRLEDFRRWDVVQTAGQEAGIRAK
ncbi:MAG: hypothetical protein QME82_03990 [Bacillota bacterium]|nr:hypothetical protein [Bacillota bacterium]